MKATHIIIGVVVVVAGYLLYTTLKPQPVKTAPDISGITNAASSLAGAFKSIFGGKDASSASASDNTYTQSGYINQDETIDNWT